jgi:parallel beta-helix repeat protein
MSLKPILVIIFATLVGLINPVSAWSRTVHVNPGQSIQAFINTAHVGDKIIVEAGIYAEQLTITTDGLTLVGHNATIVPPPNPVTNTCSGLAGNVTQAVVTQAGVCVTGSNVVFSTEPFDGEHVKVRSVGQRVKDVSISGFTVIGFAGINIAVLGAQGASVSRNTVSSSSQYGILTVGSENSKIKRNTVLSTQGPFTFYFIGICMDDVSTVTISHNDISDYFIGLCVQTAGADIHDNNVHNTCVGAFVDPGINGAKLHDNQFSNLIQSNPPCPASFSSGVTISGATNTILRSNKFSGIKNTGQAAAVVLVDDAAKGFIASVNIIEGNTFSNDDLDIYEQTTGTGNVVKKNQCGLSVPATICSNQ